MTQKPSRKGLMLILSSPSGAGKTTLTRRLLKEYNDITMSVSATTRKPREGEVDGQDYYFVTHDIFNEMVDNDQMLEHATVFDNLYGTPREPVNAALNAGNDIIFDIDWQGAQQISGKEGVVRIFILPPSITELRSRLKSRGQDDEDVISKRMSEAKNEISHWEAYNYVLINDNFEETYQNRKNILKAERLKLSQQPAIPLFARSLMNNAG